MINLIHFCCYLLTMKVTNYNGTSQSHVVKTNMTFYISIFAAFELIILIVFMLSSDRQHLAIWIVNNKLLKPWSINKQLVPLFNFPSKEWACLQIFKGEGLSSVYCYSRPAYLPCKNFWSYICSKNLKNKGDFIIL